MPRRKKGQPPAYRLHKQSGQAIVSLPLGNGTYQDVLLGSHDTQESRDEYLRVLTEWNAGGYDPKSKNAAPLSIAEVMVRFLDHAERHYRRPDGTPTGEFDNFVYAFRPLKYLYGSLPVAEFSPLKLKAVRQLLIDGYQHPKYGSQKALARGVINSRVGRIVRLFKWGVGEEIVPGSVWQALRTVPGLQEGRTDAKETDPIVPVEVTAVERTLPFLLPQVQAIVRLQLLTGMRSGEVCIMRARDIDRTNDVWLYRPKTHKTKHKGKLRVVALGPKAQEILLPWLKVTCSGCNQREKPIMMEFEEGLCALCRERYGRGTISLFKYPDVEDTGEYYLFNPQEAIQLKNRERRRNRRSKVQPSQFDRKKKTPKRKPGGVYTASVVQRAVARACELAKVPHWHPHQLRHTHGTFVNKQFGIEASSVALGHSSIKMTELYAEKNFALAVEVAKKIG